MSSDDSKRFLGTLHRTKNLKRSLQSLYNSDKTPEELQAIIDESSQVLPDLKGTGIFKNYKKTIRKIRKCFKTIVLHVHLRTVNSNKERKKTNR